MSLGAAVGAILGAITGAASAGSSFFAVLLPSLLIHPAFISKSSAMISYVFTFSQGLKSARDGINPDQIVQYYSAFMIAPLALLFLLYAVGSGSFGFSTVFFVPIVAVNAMALAATYKALLATSRQDDGNMQGIEKAPPTMAVSAPLTAEDGSAVSCREFTAKAKLKFRISRRLRRARWRNKNLKRNQKAKTEVAAPRPVGHFNEWLARFFAALARHCAHSLVAWPSSVHCVLRAGSSRERFGGPQSHLLNSFGVTRHIVSSPTSSRLHASWSFYLQLSSSGRGRSSSRTMEKAPQRTWATSPTPTNSLSPFSATGSSGCQHFSSPLTCRSLAASQTRSAPFRTSPVYHHLNSLMPPSRLAACALLAWIKPLVSVLAAALAQLGAIENPNQKLGDLARGDATLSDMLAFHAHDEDHDALLKHLDTKGFDTSKMVVNEETRQLEAFVIFEEKDRAKVVGDRVLDSLALYGGLKKIDLNECKELEGE